MRGDAVFINPYSYRSYLFLINPYSRISGRSPPPNTEFLERSYDYLLEVPYISPDVKSPWPKIHDRITDYLPRTVIGNIPAPVNHVEGYPFIFQISPV